MNPPSSRVFFTIALPTTAAFCKTPHCATCSGLKCQIQRDRKSLTDRTLSPGLQLGVDFIALARQRHPVKRVYESVRWWPIRARRFRLLGDKKIGSIGAEEF